MSSYRLNQEPSVLPSVGVWAPYKPNNLCGRIQGSSSLCFPFACELQVDDEDDEDNVGGVDRSGDGAGC